MGFVDPQTEEIERRLREAEPETRALVMIFLKAQARGDRIFGSAVLDFSERRIAEGAGPIEDDPEALAAARRIGAVCDHSEKVAWGRLLLAHLNSGDAEGVSMVTALMNRRAAC